MVPAPEVLILPVAVEPPPHTPGLMKADDDDDDDDVPPVPLLPPVAVPFLSVGARTDTLPPNPNLSSSFRCLFALVVAVVVAEGVILMVPPALLGWG